jgi:hypothetical protein
MDSSEIKKMLIASLNAEADTTEIPGKLEERGIMYGFSHGFSDKIIDRVFSGGVVKIARQAELLRYMNAAFYKVALTGVAAIIVLLISIFLTEGSLSFNSFLGLSDNYDESIICLLTGN